MVNHVPEILSYLFLKKFGNVTFLNILFLVGFVEVASDGSSESHINLCVVLCRLIQQKNE